MVENFSWELFDYLTSSSHLAPCNFRPFNYGKNRLPLQRFSNNEDSMDGANTWLSAQEAHVFDTLVQQIFPNVSVSIQ
jgi:hypothetical protein